MVKHLCCCEVYQRPTPPRWVVAPWHMLLGIKPDRNHGYWVQKNHCEGVFDLRLCVDACVRVWTQCELHGVCGSSLQGEQKHSRVCECGHHPDYCRPKKTTTSIFLSFPSFSLPIVCSFLPGLNCFCSSFFLVSFAFSSSWVQNWQKWEKRSLVCLVQISLWCLFH